LCQEVGDATPRRGRTRSPIAKILLREHALASMTGVLAKQHPVGVEVVTLGVAEQAAAA
jgi:hypothetical protein